MNRIDLYEDVYRLYLTVVIDKDFNHFRDWLKDVCGYKETEDMNPLSSGYCITLTPENSTHKGRAHIIWLKYKDIPCLVHELVHLTMQIFDDKGIPIRVENGEAFAYYIEHWIKRIRKEW